MMTLTKIGRALGRAVDFLSRKIVWLSALSVLAIFLVVVIDVIGRYFFSHPIQGSNDIGEVILVCIAYFAMPFTQLNKEHVRVTLVWGKLPPKGKAIGDGIAFLFGAVVYALIFWNLAKRTWELLAGTYPSTSETAVLGISHIPFLVVASVGALVFVFILLADSVRGFARLRAASDDTAAGKPGDQAPSAPVESPVTGAVTDP